MARIIAFPDIRETPSAPARARPATPGRDDAAPSLGALVAQMRADSKELVRCMQDLQSAVRGLADADIPGQARALAQAMGDAPGRTD